MPLSRRIIYILLTGYILAFYSEWSFWSGRPAEDYFWLQAILTWLIYSCFAYFFLAAVAYFRAKTIWAFFLAGAIYGWLGEGVFVQTMYESLPISISLTGLAWHSLLSVLIGFYYLPKKLREGKAWFACILIGLGIGFWAIGWWQEPDVALAPIENVFLYNGFFCLLLIPAYWAWLRFDIADFRPTWIGFILMLYLALSFYIFVTIPTQPISLIVLPICLALALFGLWKNRQAETPLEQSPAAKANVLPLILIPLLSSLFYAVALIFGLSLPSLAIVYLIVTPLGFIVFGMALWKLIRRPKTNLEPF